MHIFRPLLLAGAVVVLGVPGAAQAAGRDSDHDGLPNRFEKRYHLKVNRDDAAKDKDRDGLSNLAEYQAKTNPRKVDSDRDGVRDCDEDSDDDGAPNKAEDHVGSNLGDHDSDDDGVDDGDELAGSVTSFDGATLVIKRVDGTELSGSVSGATEIECREGSGTPAPVPATAARLSDGEDGEDREDGDDSGESEDKPESDDHHGDRDSKDEDEHEDDANCTSALLVAGAAVREAEVEDGVFKKIKLG